MPKLEFPMPDVRNPVFEVVIGDLVRVPLYRSHRGNLMAASPEWVKTHSQQPDAHNSLPRTQIVSALVVDSRRPTQENASVIPALEVIVGDERIRIPASCVVEVIGRDARKIKK